MTEDELLTIPEVAKILRVGTKTVYGLAQRGQIPALKVGGQWRFSLPAIRSWVEGRMRLARPEVDAAPLEADPVLAGIVRHLVEAYRPERVFVFGSTARGGAGPDSDYDLLLVVPDDSEPERTRSRLAYEVLRGTGVAADVLVWTRTRFDSRSRVVTSLPATVLREGRLVHAA